MRFAAPRFAFALVTACLIPIFASADPAPQATPPPAAIPTPEAPKAPTTGPFQIKVGDASIKFGLLLQPQADFSEGAAGYAQTLQLRRARFLVGGNFTKNVAFFFDTENGRLGGANAQGQKALASGWQTLDAVVEYRPKKIFNVAAGLIRVPTSRDALESAATEFTIDFNSYAFTATGALQGNAGRDTGVQARGYFLGDKLEYRAAITEGLREAGYRNPFRKTVRLQYNFFDTEVYNLPSYSGSNFGTKKILAIGGAYDSQVEYKGLTADVFADIPTAFGSALGTITYQNLDGGDTVKALAQNDILTVDGGLYFKNVKVGTWARYERRDFDTGTGDLERILVGINYYPWGNNFNIKAAFGQAKPAVGESANQVTIQLQAYYF